MTIDEAIEKFKLITNLDTTCPRYCMLPCDKCVYESKQLAEWLEELKDYRDKNKMVVRVDVENMDSIQDKIEELSRYAENQYNKAIDDLMEKASECFISDADWNYLVQEAKQLKAGGKDEQKRQNN